MTRGILVFSRRVRQPSISLHTSGSSINPTSGDFSSSATMGRIVPSVRFVVEIPVQFEAGRGDLFGRSGLLDDVVAGV